MRHILIIFSDKSLIVDGRGLSVSQAEEEAKQIHEENINKLSEMSEEEILAEQQQLLQVLGMTKIVPFSQLN